MSEVQIEFRIRAAEAGDARLLFNWVNQPDSLAAKLKTTGAIQWIDHSVWFGDALGRADKAIWIAEDLDGAALGQTRLELVDDTLEVDIYVTQAARGSGVASALLSAAAREAARLWPGTDMIATIRLENPASRKFFEGLGFKRLREGNNVLVYSCDPQSIAAGDIETSSRYAASNALYDRAVKRIPQASQTYSKSPQNMVHGAAPLFIDHGRGAKVWDVDGNEYIDFVLGLLPVVLGYCDPDVDRAIVDQLGKGISFSLATPLEIELAERLARHIPCAEMARFCKNGSDATTGAVRLSRAFTDRDRVMLAGYHGWHDWYIGSTPKNAGVPKAVSDLSTRIDFNDLDRVADSLAAEPDDYAAIVLEPDGLVPPEPGYLEGLRDLCDRYGVVLVFDEIVTGFRASLGGAQVLHGVTPDLACFGKAMGNGMPVSALVGKRSIMGCMEEVFVSGTFGGEALSLAAAIATIDKMERKNAVARITDAGNRMKPALDSVLQNAGLGHVFSMMGPGWWPGIRVTSPEGLTPAQTNSLLRQELWDRGIMMNATMNLCLAHTEDGILDEALSRWAAAATAAAEKILSPDPLRHLKGRAIQPVYKVRS